MENQGFPTIPIEKIMMKFLKKNLNPKRIGGTIWSVPPHQKRKKMGIKYDETTGLPSNENVDYNKLLEMWRNEKKKRQEAEDRIKELENSLSIALDINDKYQRENKKLNEQVRDAEGETSIVKAVGINSPEMKQANVTIVELRQRINELMSINKSHQDLMGKQIVENEELKRDNKALAKQIDDYFNARLDSVRKSGA